MGLVDLRGRAGERRVRALLERAGASPDRYVDGDWVLVGWTAGGELVACVGVERVSDEEVWLHDLYVLEPFRRRGMGRALIEAVAAGAPVERLVVDAGEDGAAFLERCGFAVEAGRFTRTISIQPAPAQSVSAVTLADLEQAIRDSWGQDTSADPNKWTEENPARGQCDATAVLVRELLGGEILISNVLIDGKRVERHAWNRLPSGITVDLTRDQFRNGEDLDEPVAQEPLALGDAPRRHRLLAERVSQALRRR